MKWSEIKERFPNAFALFVKTELNNIGASDKCTIESSTASVSEDIYNVYHDKYETRDLYDFFDRAEIIVQVCAADVPDKWCTYILEVGKISTMSPYKYTSRIQAENSAFLSAFALLQERLVPLNAPQ